VGDGDCFEERDEDSGSVSQEVLIGGVIRGRKDCLELEGCGEELLGAVVVED
jgi:hypothetical protein